MQSPTRGLTLCGRPRSHRWDQRPLRSRPCTKQCCRHARQHSASCSDGMQGTYCEWSDRAAGMQPTRVQSRLVGSARWPPWPRLEPRWDPGPVHKHSCTVDQTRARTAEQMFFDFARFTVLRVSAGAVIACACASRGVTAHSLSPRQRELERCNCLKRCKARACARSRCSSVERSDWPGSAGCRWLLRHHRHSRAAAAQQVSTQSFTQPCGAHGSGAAPMPQQPGRHSISSAAPARDPCTCRRLASSRWVVADDRQTTSAALNRVLLLRCQHRAAVLHLGALG